MKKFDREPSDSGGLPGDSGVEAPLGLDAVENFFLEDRHEGIA